MSNLQQILSLVNSVQSHDELQQINQAIRSRWHVIGTVVAQKTVQEKALVNGTPVSFTHRGQTIYGTVRTVNHKTVSVEPQGGGRHWRVSPGLLTKLDKLPAPTAKRSEMEIMKDIADVYNRLSPEWLAADGERPRHQVISLERQLRAKHVKLFAELGRVVSEMEVSAWELKQQGISIGPVAASMIK